MKTGVMICGHGSRSQSAVDEFRVLAEKLPAYLPDDWMTDYGYLEFANPVHRHPAPARRGPRPGQQRHQRGDKGHQISPLSSRPKSTAIFAVESDCNFC